MLNVVFMITEKDFYDIIGKKVSNEIMKNMIKAMTEIGEMRSRIGD